MQIFKYMLLILVFLVVSKPVFATTYTVTSTADTSGSTCGSTCTLRQAITAANASKSTPHTINFNIPTTDTGYKSGVWTISPGSQLPALTGGSITINGTSQTGSSANTANWPSALNSKFMIVLDGTGAGSTSRGLQITSASNVIKGLVIANFKSTGIEVSGTTATGNKIQGCIVGLDATGKIKAGNGGVGGVYFASANNNTLGSDSDGVNDAAERNIISANISNGVAVAANSNRIAGNFIGTDITGSTGLGNTGYGINISGSSNTIGTGSDGVSDAYEGNVISGNGGLGAYLSTTADKNIFAGNYIGTNAAGTAALANASYGIYVAGTNTKIGVNTSGTSGAVEGNIISGNTGNGVEINGSATGTVIAGNMIGSDATGNKAIPNTKYGVSIVKGTNRVGTDGDGVNDSAEGNFISGNTYSGVFIYTSATTANVVAGNTIGLGKDGTTALGNAMQGIEMKESTNNTIGGDSDAETNIITNNGKTSSQYGVFVNGATTTGSQILRNRIYKNYDTEIRVNAGAKTAPVIKTDVLGTVSGTATAKDTVQVFRASGDGGDIYIGQTTADSTGAWSLALGSTYGVSGNKITATATDTTGTSQFASAYTLTSTAPATSTSPSISATTYYQDSDGDTYGNAAVSKSSTTVPTGYVTNSTDCNDTSAAIKPGATEVCDSIDNNCSGAADEGLTMTTYYLDSDGDGYGSSATSKSSCSAVTGYVTNSTDCNDTSAAIKPGATETCDSIDNNCSGVVDEGVTTVFYQDADGDGYGNSAVTQSSCTSPSGYVANATDCNDADKTISPAGTEVCDSVDNNCSGAIDEGLTTTTYYLDSDGDGYGSSATSKSSCLTAVAGYVINSTDCNDGDSTVSPVATEVCDSKDNNCNSSTDEGVTTTYYQDSDGDGYGNSAVSQASCSPVSGYVTNHLDNDDTVAATATDGSETTNTETTSDTTVTLATEGVAQVGIYYADTASDESKTAATEVKTYLDKMTGASFTLSAISATDAATTKGIFIGTTTDFPFSPEASTGRLVENTTVPMSKEAFAIDVLPDQVLLIGATNKAMSHVGVRFLDALGCRWFFQGKNWEVVPSTPTLTFSEEIYEQPKMAYRFLQGVGIHDKLDEAGNLQCFNDENDWHRHNHSMYWNSTGTSWNSGVALPLVSMQVWDLAISEINKYQDNFLNFGAASPPDDNLHPDPDNRYGWLTTNQNHKTIEIANSAVRDAYWKWLTERYFTVYDIDGVSMPIEEGDGSGEISQSTSALGINSACAPSCSDSDMMVTLANDMAQREATRESADPSLKRRYVTFLGGYLHLSPPTISLTPHSTYVNVFPIYSQSVGAYTTTTALFDGWAAKGAELSIFDDYSYFQDRSLIGSNYSQSFDGLCPDVPNDPGYLGAQIKSFVEHGLTGAAIEAEDNFGYHGIGYYLALKMMWDSTADVDAILADFYDKAYVLAKKNMQAYHELFDPKGQPQIITRDVMAQALGYLDAAATDAASDPAVIARINDLKCYMHYNSLWWQIYRAEYNSDAQKQLVRDLFSMDYRIRGSYMETWQDDLAVLMPAAAKQFADGSADWSATDTSASWRATSTYPTQAEIDAWFTADTAYFAPDSVTQVNFTGQPEAVSDFNTMSGASQGAPVMPNGPSGKPYTLALYTPAGTTSLTLGFNVGQLNTTSSPASPLTVTLTDANGVSYGTQTVNPGAYGSSAYQNVTFSSLPEKTGFTAAVNDYGSFSQVTGSTSGGIDMPMAVQLDKIARRSTGVYSPASNGLYFYVPKGTTEIQYDWNRMSDSNTDNPIAIPFSGTGCHAVKSDGITETTALEPGAIVTTPNDGTQTQCIVDPAGNITTVNDFRQVIKIPVTAGNDGKLWRILLSTHGPSTRQLWFYNIPPYLSDSPTSMVIPHDLVVTDGLTPR